jgi:hypothetical protein
MTSRSHGDSGARETCPARPLAGLPFWGLAKPGAGGVDLVALGALVFAW